MLCEFLSFSNFWATWALLFSLGALSILISSGITFYIYYVKADYDKWLWKTNPKYPSPELVKQEIQKTIKGAFFVTLCPALSIYLAQNNYSHSYCTPKSFQNELGQFIVLWIVTDFYEFFYHYLGHRFEALWENHKSHHLFFNPSPFAVIADDLVDQFFRSLPLVLFPLFFEVNLDLMFAQWGMLFYGYGTYLHWGYESQYIDAHNKVLNTAYDHHLHHAKSIKNKPIRTGFFFKIWDDLFGSTYKGDCFCVRCQQKQGKKSLQEWNKVTVPDYSVLISPKFWMGGMK